MPDPSPSTSAGPIRIDGSEQDAALSRSEFLTRPEVLNRRSRRVKQLARILRDHYWALMEELKRKYREYYWEFGKSPYIEDEENERLMRVDGGAGLAVDNGNGNSGINGGLGIGNSSSICSINGCNTKAMALTRFCHRHILSDPKQKLYKHCAFNVKSSMTGPMSCVKPALRSTVPCYCPDHFQTAEKYLARALKKSGLNGVSTSKLAPKVHVIVAEYARQIQQKRRIAKRRKLGKAQIKVEKKR